MRMTYLLHILAGSLGLLFGYVALYATKGSTLHRRSGMLFVVVMLTTAVAGMVMATVRDVAPVSSAGRAADHVLLAVAGPYQTELSGSRWHQRN